VDVVLEGGILAGRPCLRRQHRENEAVELRDGDKKVYLARAC